MTKEQLAYLKTLKRTNSVLLKFKSIWSAIPAFATQRSVLNSKVELIQSIAIEQEQDNRGIAADKDRMAEILVTSMMAVMGPIGAWAMVERNETLRRRMDVSPSTLRKLSADRLSEQARALLVLAREQAGNLAPYAITPELLEALEARQEIFDGLVVAPREGQARTKTLTELLRREIEEAMNLLRLFFDRMIYRFEEDEPEFFLNYQNARKVVRQGARTRRDATATSVPEIEATPHAATDSQNEEATAEEVHEVLHGRHGAPEEADTALPG